MPIPCPAPHVSSSPGRLRPRSATRAIVGLLIAVSAFCMLAGQPSRAERRLALVIGNADYDGVGRLQNTVSDARAMRQQLEATGFEVIFRENLDRRSMNRAVDEFVGRLSSDTVALLYFAGHGVQIGATNYLLPTDIRAETANDVASDAIDLTRVLERVTGTQARFSLAIIDACRDNPFRVAGRSLGVARGLAPSTTADGVMVVYSAGANQTALDRLSDRDADPNGVFTREWLRTAATPGLSIQDVAVRVRQSVAALAKTVGHVQTPAVYDQSTGTFALVPGAAVAVAIPQVPRPPATATAPADAPAPPVQACDRLAQPLRRMMGRQPAMADGVAAEVLDAAAARTACAQAMRDWPGEPRFVAYAARASSGLGDHREAARLYRIASDGGNAIAQNNLGAMYEAGQGVARDQREALRLYKLAVEQGYPRAMSNLGELYVSGRGGVRDEREAVRLFKLGAAEADAPSQTNLGIMYAEGRGGLARDPSEATRLWRDAAGQGDPNAQRNLRRLTGGR